MLETNLFHIKEDDQGTIGVFSIPELTWSCYINELPDRKNRSNISRIPNGRYLVKVRQSPKYDIIFHVTNVKGRSYILMHAGNFAGDVKKGWRTDSQGCLLMGRKVGLLWVGKKQQRVVLNSRTTLLEFMDLMDNKSFYLNVA